MSRHSAGWHVDTLIGVLVGRYLERVARAQYRRLDQSDTERYNDSVSYTEDQRRRPQ